jgi:putative transposase
MIRFSFRKGLRFFERQRIWTLLRRLVNQKFQLEDEQGEVMTLSQSEILARWEKRELIVDEESISSTENAFYLATPRDLSTYREDLRAAATRRQYYLTKLGDHLKMSVAKQLRPHIKRIAADLGDANAPSPITIYRWWVIPPPNDRV